MRHLELFSGIGGFRMAMEHLAKDGITNFDTVGYSEIDANAVKTYNANFSTIGELPLGDIVSFVNDEQRLVELPRFDILSGGFPCQTFSMMGKQMGFEEDRGQMFFRIMDIVRCKRPPYILLENVKNLLTHDKKRTFKVICRQLEEAGYRVKYDIFNTANFGLPQKRNRLIVFARLAEMGAFDFDSSTVQEEFKHINRDRCSLHFYDTTIDVLSEKVEAKYYLSERIKPTILSNGSASFQSDSDIDQRVARPLTATMNKMHRACQDNYFSDVYILSKGKERPSEKLSKAELATLAIRKLTPQEAFMLQGFPNDFASRASEVGVSNGALYKQAGNAVSVNTIYAVLYYLLKNQILKTDVI